MRVICKYDLNGPGETTELALPENARAIHAAEQDGRLRLWVLTEVGAPLVTRRFVVKGTGWDIGQPVEHVATVHSGPFLWHVLEWRGAP